MKPFWTETVTWICVNPKPSKEGSFHALSIAGHAGALWSCLVPVHGSFRWIGVFLAAWCHTTWPQTNMTFKSGPTKVRQDTTKFPLMVSEVLPRSTSRWLVRYASLGGCALSCLDSCPTSKKHLHLKHTRNTPRLPKQMITTQTTLWRPFQVLKHKGIKLIIDVDVSKNSGFCPQIIH